jgi:hypothetical protein
MKESSNKPIPQKRQRTAGLWYISFSGYSDFLGAAFVRARDKRKAIQRTLSLRIHPGPFKVADVLCLEVPRRDRWRVPMDFRNRLLCEEEIKMLSSSSMREDIAT